MPKSSVTVVALDASLEPRAQALTERLRTADWGSAGVAVACASASDAFSQSKSSAAVILSSARSRGELLSTVESLEEAGRPVLALVDDGSPVPGALADRIDAPPETIVALLRGLLHRQSEIDILQRDVAISARCTGGLHGEIARMHEEMQMAAMVQREFLPGETPPLHNVHFGTIWRPSSYVSGDIFDVVRLDEDHVGLFLADAVGHGVPAALLTMVICRSLPTREAIGRSYRIVPPSEAMARLNAEMIRRQSGTPRFATAVYGVLDCRRRTFTLAGAGHPPPILLKPDGSMRRLETEGGLLGIFPHERFEQIEVPLEVDDALLIYSDGFEQAFPAPGESSGANERYLDEFRELSGEGDATSMVDRIRARLDSASGSLHQPDDVTLICATANALGRVLEKSSPAAAATAGRTARA
ncbi:MAG: serine/threonine-protein phosphatase [Phycisphaerales bacterium]|nr:serine/threonine-protein phosphatase [Phycisphaerales bacterium]